MATTHPETHVNYLEKVRPSPGIWALCVCAAASTALMVFPVWRLGAVVLPVIAFLLLFLWMRSLTVRIVVTDTQLIVGEAHIERTFVAAAHAYDAEAARVARGVELNARAFLVLRPWVKPAVKIDIADETDPTPYWLVSSNHPEEFAAALGDRPRD
ncbi:DUF3093 family protein [Brevibacterium sanguinis]|uniref:DUF3093 family protein n=2 Tax=Brevibacterium TaxID=1696 RepID=A0A366IJ36_9MICO|nr:MULTISPECIES: DUF3093 domain-containing protein [Brevibacterium]RBP64005.1 DUF3093 family protein [Brevibacterium sanguinis]RBP70720.1 DUF3093 family protein [Brevibacterium celere]